MASDLVRQLLEAGVHFGHQTKRWNPKMKRFLFGSRSGIYIVDLEKTENCLKQACEFLEEIASKGQLILYVGTKKQARLILQEQAQRAVQPYVVNRWLGGTLTNFQTIKANIDRLNELRKQKEEGLFERISKKDAKRLSHQLQRLEENFSGLADLTRTPGCLFIIDTKREDIAVREANRLGIPIVAVCDTNADPDVISHPIPGNDDALRAIRLITTLVTDSIIAGRKRHELSQQAVAIEQGGDEQAVASGAASSKESGDTGNAG